MTDTEKRELDKKLAVHFLGIKKIYYDEEWDTDKINPMYIPSGKPWRTHRIDAKIIPYFTFSFDACIKWIVPKLDYFCLQKEEYGDKGFYADVSIGEQYAEYYQGETLALAFCLAVEKLIGKEE